MNIKEIESYGYRMVTREEFLEGGVAVEAFSGSPDCSPEELDVLHAGILKKLRDRVEGVRGSHVLFDPRDDEDGWLAVGTPDEVVQAFAEWIEEGAA